MLTLHLDIISEESAALPGDRVGTAPRAVRNVGGRGATALLAAFRGERPVGLDGNLVPLVGDELLEAVCEVVWFKDEVRLEGECVIPSMRNLLMFLSDVRTRCFKAGIFLGDDVLAAAETFRAAASTVADGTYLPHLVEDAGGFAARWLPLDTSRGAFFAWLVDGLARFGGRTPLETGASRPDTVHDAWISALRSDTGRIAWPDEDDIRALMHDLAVWRAPLRVSAADRAALRFSLEPPAEEDGTWRLRLASVPRTRAGLISLGQAASLFPPLAALRGTEAELDRAAAESFLRTGAQALVGAGYAVEPPPGLLGEHVAAEADLAPVSDEPSAPVTTKLTIRVDGEVVTEQEIQFLLDQNSPFVFFRDRWIEVDRAVLREALRALRDVKGKKVAVHDAIALAFGLRRAGGLRVDRVRAHGWLRGLINELRGEQRFRVLETPAGFNGTLRDYQLRGASWLAFLAKWGFGACLADDMGLGKTAQTIAFILHRKASRPALVVAPVSVTTNWTRELARFAPSLKVYLHQGAERHTGSLFSKACREADVVVTGYALFAKDFTLFAENVFSALVLDEAQTVKNPDTRISRAVRALDVPVRVALTGTPLENSADDLWALEAFLNPGLLGERKEFADAFTRVLRADAHAGVASRLRHILEPFMLRRLKTEPGIAAELGERREIREWCTLNPRQRALYESALATFREEMSELADVRKERAGEADRRVRNTRRGRILALLTELKEICDSSALVEGGEAADGGKVRRLDELLDSIFDAGESCLVFTQYARMGRLLRAHLQERFGRRFPFLHGSLSPAQRDEEIAAFNADSEPNAFILSLKAGGFGLNLTRATHVIHFDRWWNPAVENQATDRAHRIGQLRDVFVHLFICAGTLEERVDELLETKRRLAGEIVGSGESFLLKMSDREFERMVSLDGE